MQIQMLKCKLLKIKRVAKRRSASLHTDEKQGDKTSIHPYNIREKGFPRNEMPGVSRR